MHAAAAAVALVASLAVAEPAAAVLPPRATVLVAPAKGTIGGLRVGQPLLPFAFDWGPPDRTLPAPPGEPVAGVAVWLGLSHLARAVVTFADAGQTHADSIFYTGPLRTLRGDRNGTPLARVLAHWPRHGRTTPFASMRGYVEVKVLRIWFVFDDRRRLAGARAGSASAESFATLRP